MVPPNIGPKSIAKFSKVEFLVFPESREPNFDVADEVMEFEVVDVLLGEIVKVAVDELVPVTEGVVV